MINANEKDYFVNKKEGEQKLIHFENVEQLFGYSLAVKIELRRETAPLVTIKREK